MSTTSRIEPPDLAVGSSGRDRVHDIALAIPHLPTRFRPTVAHLELMPVECDEPTICICEELAAGGPTDKPFREVEASVPKLEDLLTGGRPDDGRVKHPLGATSLRSSEVLVGDIRAVG